MSKKPTMKEWMSICDNLTDGQTVAREAWDLRWEVERLEKLVAKRDAEITALRFDNAMLKAELNSVRGKR